MNYLFITNNATIAEYAVKAGVDRIFIDLEIQGKIARQGHLNTVINHHSIEDIPAVRAVTPEGSLLVRVNPWHEHSIDEIRTVIEMGADHIMLPMFHDVDTAAQFVAAVQSINPRVNPILLVETQAAFEQLDAIVKLPIKEFYIGLNDLSIDANMPFLFQPLAEGWLDRAATIAHGAGVTFGFGGIGRLGEGTLPADLILAEHVRLQSSAVILSRAFHKNSTTVAELESHVNLAEEISNLRLRETTLAERSQQQIADDTQQLQRIVAQIVSDI